MDADALHELMKKFIIVLTFIWCLFLFPALILVVFALEGVLGFPTDNSAVHLVLYYNILAFPVLLLSSLGLSWGFLHFKQYWPAIACALLPLLTFFVEIVAADIALLFL